MVTLVLCEVKLLLFSQWSLVAIERAQITTSVSRCKGLCRGDKAGTQEKEMSTIRGSVVLSQDSQYVGSGNILNTKSLL